MKLILTLSLFVGLACSTQVQSQSFSFNPIDSLNHTDTFGQGVSHAFRFQLKNLTPDDTLNLRWRLVNELKPELEETWTLGLAVYVLFSLVDLKSRPFTVNGDTSFPIYLYTNPNSIVGSDTFRFCVFEEGDSAGTIQCHTPHYTIVDADTTSNDTTTIISKNSLRHWDIYPNPSFGRINVSSSHHKLSKIVVNNMVTGQRVQQIDRVLTDKQTINLPTGLYLITLQFDSGEIVHEKLLITK